MRLVGDLLMMEPKPQFLATGPRPKGGGEMGARNAVQANDRSVLTEQSNSCGRTRIQSIRAAALIKRIELIKLRSIKLQTRELNI